LASICELSVFIEEKRIRCTCCGIGFCCSLALIVAKGIGESKFKSEGPEVVRAVIRMVANIIGADTHYPDGL